MSSLFLQLAVIVGAARLFGTLFHRLGQPRVCGEIAAGLVLGPSLLGGLLPDLHARLFPAAHAPLFGALSEVGLVLLMFLVGVTLEMTEIRARKGATCAISLAGIVVPFVLGLGLADLLHPRVAADIDAVGFRLFVATAVSITAIPTLARILDECNLTGTHIASVSTTAAALDDVVGWTLLAAVTAMVQSQFSGAVTAARLGGTLLFAAFMIGMVRPRVVRYCESVRDARLFDRSAVLGAVFVAVCLGATVTTAIGLSSVFGAFIVGVTVSGDPRLRQALIDRLHVVVVTLFLPLFFAYTGLRTDIGTLHGWTSWLLCGVVIAVAVVGKIGGCALAARVQGMRARDAWSIGILMNTRGLMELIVVNLGLDLGVISPSVFFMLVLMAVVTTFMTTPLIRRLLRHTELEALVERAPFGRGIEPSPAR